MNYKKHVNTSKFVTDVNILKSISRNILILVAFGA